MTDNHMVFFTEIAFIYGGNDSSEKDVFGSEKSSEKIIKSSERSSETTAISSGTHRHKFLDKPSGKAECRNSHTIGIKRDFFLFLLKVAKASMRFLPFLSHRTTVSVDKC